MSIILGQLGRNAFHAERAHRQDIDVTVNQ